MTSIRHLLPTPSRPTAPNSSQNSTEDVVPDEADSITPSGSDEETEGVVRKRAPSDRPADLTEVGVDDAEAFHAAVDSTNLGLFLGQTMPVVPMSIDENAPPGEQVPFYYLRQLWQFFDTPFGRDVEIDIHGSRVVVHYVPHLSSVQLFKKRSSSRDGSRTSSTNGQAASKAQSSRRKRGEGEIPGLEGFVTVPAVQSAQSSHNGDLMRGITGTNGPVPLTVPTEPPASAWGVPVGLSSHTHTQEPKSWSSILTAPKSTYHNDFPALADQPGGLGGMDSHGRPLAGGQGGEYRDGEGDGLARGSMEQGEEEAPELLYSFHETETPDRRIPLPEKIAELSRRKNGFNLLRLKSTDLDPRSWIAIHWVPILCHTHTRALIRGSFMTYYRLDVNTISEHWPGFSPSGSQRGSMNEQFYTRFSRDSEPTVEATEPVPSGLSRTSDTDGKNTDDVSHTEDSPSTTNGAASPGGTTGKAVETQTSNQPLYNRGSAGTGDNVTDNFPESTSSLFDQGAPVEPPVSTDVTEADGDAIVQVETVTKSASVVRKSSVVKEGTGGRSPIRLRRSILRDDDNSPLPGLRRSARDDDSLFGRPYPRGSQTDDAHYVQLKQTGCLDFIGFVPHKILESTWYRSRDPLISTANVPAALLQSVADWLAYVGCMPNDFRHCFLSDNLSEMLSRNVGRQNSSK